MSLRKRYRRMGDMVLKVRRLDKGVDKPAYAHEHDAAFDLPSREDVAIGPGEQAIVKTGLAVAIPPGYAGLIWDRSGLAAKSSLHVFAGVIDAGYRGEIGVVIKNFGDRVFHVEKNMRIAQMLIQPVARPEIVEAEELDETTRSSSGFGSTGLR